MQNPIPETEHGRSMPPSRERRTPARLGAILRSKKFIWLILLVAAILRCGYAIHKPVDERDARFYREIGRNLADGRGYVWDGGHEASFWAPVAAYVIAGVYKVGGHDLAVREVWAVIGILCVLAAFLAVRERHGIVAANLAAIGVALYPYNLLMGGSTSTEIVAVLFLFLLLWLFFRWVDTNSLLFAGLAGLALGLSVLNRPAVAAFVLVLPVLYWVLSRRQSVRRALCGALIFVLTAIAVVAPWSIRISRASGTPCLVTSVGPGILWLGWNPWVKDYLDGHMAGTVFMNHVDGRTYSLYDQTVPWTQKNQAYRAAFAQFVTENPGASFKLMIYRTIKFWQIPGLSSIRTEPEHVSHAWLVILVGCLSYVPLAAITIWAIVWMLRHRQIGEIAVYLLWILVGFGTNIWFSSTITRYRFAAGVDELMMVIAAVFMAKLLEAPRASS